MMFISQIGSTAGDAAMSQATPRPPAVRMRTLVLIAVAIAKEHGIGSPQWNEFGALTAMEIGMYVWDVKRAAIRAVTGDAFELFETGHA